QPVLQRGPALRPHHALAPEPLGRPAGPPGHGDGTGHATITTDRFRVPQLLDADGSAIIIHTLPDNQANIPNRYAGPGGKTGPDIESRKPGDSGARVACGVISKR